MVQESRIESGVEGDVVGDGWFSALPPQPLFVWDSFVKRTPINLEDSADSKYMGAGDL